MRVSLPRRVGYLMSQFPEVHETFILREIQAVHQTPRLALEIFSLKRCRDRIIHDAARPFVPRIVYPTRSSVARGLATLTRSARARAVLREVLCAYRGSPVSCAKAVTTLVLAGGVLSEARRRGVEHVHAHWATMPALAAYFMRRIEGLPYSVSAHAWDIYAERTLLREKMLAAEFVVTCTAANRETLAELGLPREKVHVSYHGLDFGALPAPRFDRTGPMRLLAVGRLVEQKGFAFLIEAAAELRHRGHALELRIIGEGPLRGALEERLTARGLEDAARLPGQLPQREVFEAYRWASSFVAPSVIASDGDRDGIPNVVLEAMSQGVPVVSTAVSGIPEVVRPGETGWLAPPGDAEALANAIEAAHRDASGALPRAAYALVRREFDVTRNVAVLVTWLSGSLMTASSP